MKKELLLLTFLKDAIMAQDLTNKKKDWASQAVVYAAKAAALTRDIAELINYWNDNGFASGGANPITQADLDGPENGHLTPALLATFVTAIGNVALSGGQRTTLRQVAKQVIPGG
jgi:hypothetical protein